jgi:2-methylaconitate cis-trans-isomerase PrpF
MEQMLFPITVIRGGTSRAFFFEKRNVPPAGEGLEEFLLAVRGSPDPMGTDGLGGAPMLQSKVAIVSPSERPDADVDYTFVQIFPESPANVSYKLNCGNISAGVPVFALMKNMIPNVPDGSVTVRVFSTNSGKMMYMTLDVLNGEARVAGDATIGGVPGTGSPISIDFRDQAGAWTGELFPTGNLVDTVTMDDGTKVDVTVLDLANVAAFYEPASLGISTGLELPDPSLAIVEPPGMKDRIIELRLKIAQLIGWNQYTLKTIGDVALPWAVSVLKPTDYAGMFGQSVRAQDVDLVARFYASDVLHSAAPGTGSCTLAAGASIPGTIPNRVLPPGDLRDGKGGGFTFGHPSGTFALTTKPIPGNEPNDTRFAEMSYPRTARIISDGTIYIKNEAHEDTKAWKHASEVTAQSFFLQADSVIVQR